MVPTGVLLFVCGVGLPKCLRVFGEAVPMISCRALSSTGGSSLSCRVGASRRWGRGGEARGNVLLRKPSVGMVVTLSMLGGFALGIGTLPTHGLDESEAEIMRSSSAADEFVPSPASATEFRELKDDPQTAVYEPFIGCSAEYVNRPGAALDRSNMIGPENSVMVSPAEMKSMGRPGAEVGAQAQGRNELSQEERGEQLCRAAQQNAVIEEPR